MSIPLINTILRAAINDLNLGYAIATENATFDDKSVDYYLELFILPAGTIMMGKKSTSSDEMSGILQVNIWARKGVGTSIPEEISDSIIKGLPYGIELVRDSQTVRILEKSNEAAISRDGWWIFPLSLTYNTYNAR